MEFEIPDVSPETVLQVAEGVQLAARNGRDRLTTQELARYINKSNEAARRGAIAAEQLGWLQREAGMCRSPKSHEVALAAVQQRPVVFRQALQRYRPFLLFVTLLSRGSSSSDSARKASVILRVPGDPKIAEKSLRSWGAYAGVLTSGARVGLSEVEDGLPPDYILRLAEALKDELRAKIYVIDKVGPDVLSWVDDDVLDSLCGAMGMHEKHPAQAVEEAGKALEDVLRNACAHRGLDGRQKNGIGSLATLLQENGSLTDKHKQIACGLAAVRTMGAHGKDKQTLERWTVRSDAALESILLTISTIRSLWSGLERGEQVF